jgi:hypothetical protein
MASEHKGTLGKNKRKEKDTHPDLKGSATIAGIPYWISGWRREKDGETFYSLAFEPKAEQQGQAQSAKPKAEDIGSDIPW